MALRDYYQYRQLDSVVKDIPRENLPTLSDLRTIKSSPTCLTYTSEAAQMRTHFRDYVLQIIFEAAQRELGDTLKSANVLVEYDQYEPEPVPPALVVSMAADIDGEQFGIAHRAVSKAVAKEVRYWSKSEREDYLKRIHYVITPLRI